MSELRETGTQIPLPLKWTKTVMPILTVFRFRKQRTPRAVEISRTSLRSEGCPHIP